MKYKLVIFDLDGTILDTLEDLAASVNSALKGSGFNERSLTEVRRFVGNGIRKLIERSVPENTEERETDKVFEDFKAHYKIHCADKTKPYDGIKELLNNLKNAGVKLAVVSNKADFAVQELCKSYFPDMLDIAVGEKADVRRKPYPDSVNEVLKKLNIAKEEAVYVGDSEVDIETAKNADMDCISVDWGFRDTAYLKEQGASVILSQPKEIFGYIS